MDIKVKITRTRFNRPMMLLDGGPFNGTELTPHQAKFLGAALAGTADAVAEEDVTGRHWKPRTVVLRDALGDKAPATDKYGFHPDAVPLPVQSKGDAA